MQKRPDDSGLFVCLVQRLFVVFAQLELAGHLLLHVGRNGGTAGVLDGVLDKGALAQDVAHGVALDDLAVLVMDHFVALDHDLAKTSLLAELVSRLSVLIAHLLKWQFQPARRSRSWRNTILTQREEIEALLEDSPSLRSELETLIPVAFARAGRLAEDETGIEQDAFGESCPFTLKEILGEDSDEIL